MSVVKNIHLLDLDLFFFFKRETFKNFIYFWPCWSLLLLALSLVVASGGFSSVQCMDFSFQWLLLFQSLGSRAWDQ